MRDAKLEKNYSLMRNRILDMRGLVTTAHQIDRPWLDNAKRRNNVASAEFSKSYFLNQRMLRNTRAASHALIHIGGGVFRLFSWLSQKRQPAAVHNH